MLEKQRLAYLECFGVDNYVPRRTLLGAAPSPLLSDELLQDPVAFSIADLNETGSSHHLLSADEYPVDASHDTVTNNGESMDSTSSLQSITEILAGDVTGTDERPLVATATDIVAVKKVKEVNTDDGIVGAASINSTTVETEGNNATPKRDVSSTDSSGATLQFVLNVWRVNDLLIVDSRQPASALPTDRLLQNILCSIGYRIAQLPVSELLRWPLFTSTQFANTSPEHDEDEARAMVQAYVSAQCLREPTQAVLLLGEEACAFALTPDQPREAFFAEHQGTAMMNDMWKLNTVVAPSLVDMLQEPHKKRLTWQALQILMTGNDQE